MRRTAGVLAALLLLTGCTSTSTSTSTSTVAATVASTSTSTVAATSTSTVAGSPTPPAAGSTLGTALSRVPAAALGSDGYFEFGDSARLRQLASTDPKTWKFEVYAGGSMLSDYAAVTVQTIGIDLSTATVVLTVGQPPDSVVLVAGGQNASRISAAAMKSGWTGSAVLTRKPDLGNGSSTTVAVSLIAEKIRPIGADVVTGQVDGDPAGIAVSGATAPSSADELPGVTSAIACLGNVATATGSALTLPDASAWTAVGAGGGTAGSASAVICLGAADTAAANSLAQRVRSALNTGRSKLTQQRWPELLQSAQVDVVPGSPTMVRIKAGIHNAGLVRQLLAAKDLPGR